MPKKYLITLIALLMPGFSFASTTHEYRLTNGLKLLVKEDHRAPVVISEIWYKVGSSYEPWGITGISHALEHMMFKGTPRYPGNRFSILMAAHGAWQNASTSNDYTFYYQQLAANQLSLSFKLEADRMRHLSLKAADFAKEINVVKEERRWRVDDNPQMLTYERFEAAAYIATTCHQPAIGWMNDLQQMNIDDLHRWYTSWYGPNNATVVVVGDVKPAEVLALAKQYFGDLPKIKLPALKSQEELPALGSRRVNVSTHAKLPFLLMGYNVPSLKTAEHAWEPYALDVLASILDGNQSSRNQKELVRGRNVAMETSINYQLASRLPTLFVMSGTPSSNHTISELEMALLSQIKRLQNAPVTEEELARVKTQVVAHKQYSLDRIEQQANELGRLESIGLSWHLADDYVKNIQAVTTEQIQDVAKRYLTETRLTVATLNPI